MHEPTLTHRTEARRYRLRWSIPPKASVHRYVAVGAVVTVGAQFVRQVVLVVLDKPSHAFAVFGRSHARRVDTGIRHDGFKIADRPFDRARIVRGTR